MLDVHQIVTGPWRQNCFVACSDSGHAAIVDPGADASDISACVDDLDVEIEVILITHGHFDHIGAVAELRELYGVPCLLHAGDHRLVRRANLYRKVFDAAEPIEIPAVDPLPLDRPIELVPGLEIEPIFTPGHTEGGVCFRIGDDLFSGDTFHRGRRGRVDLPGGDAKQLTRSVDALRSLPTAMRVHPGHGEATTIGDELCGGALATSGAPA